jgi:hypothetical protein
VEFTEVIKYIERVSPSRKIKVDVMFSIPSAKYN